MIKSLSFEIGEKQANTRFRSLTLVFFNVVLPFTAPVTRAELIPYFSYIRTLMLSYKYSAVSENAVNIIFNFLY